MDIDKLFNSKIFKFITLGLIVFIILLFVFRLGVMVGFQKANFSYKWGENYHNNFAGPRNGFMNNIEKGNFENKDFIDSHGTFGEIIKIEGNIIIVKGKDNVEKSILIKDDTSIVRFRDNVKITDLKIGELLVVLGSANDKGQIEAKLVRIMPSPILDNRNMPIPPIPENIK